MIHHRHLTRSACAILAAGKHLQTKDGEDPFAILSRKFGEHTDEVIRRLGEMEGDAREVKDQLLHLEQKMARGGSRGAGERQAKSWGEQFVENDGLKTFAEDRSRPSRFRMNVKATNTTALDSGGSLQEPARDNVVTMPRRRMTVRRLLNTISVSSNSVEYPTQTGRTNNAAPVAEGAAKPKASWPLSCRPCRRR